MSHLDITIKLDPFIWPILVTFDLEEKVKRMNLLKKICLTRPFSFTLVIMTTILQFFSNIMRQKSAKVFGIGPWVAM